MKNNVSRSKVKKGKAYKHLTFTERLQIEAWVKAKVPVKKMAEMLGKCSATVYNELKRGEYERLDGATWIYYKSYSPDIAESKYRENLKAKGASLKIGNDIELANYIERKIIDEKYSPKAVLGEIKEKGIKFRTTISPTTLYSYIDKGIFLNLSNSDLPVKSHKKKNKYKHIVRPSKPPKGTSIEKRPDIIDERSTIGNWEMDCVVGKQGTKEALLVLTERQTRREIVRFLPQKTAKNVVSALDKIEKKMGSRLFRKIFQTITVDNGVEFADVKGLERSVLTKGKRTELFYCHPYCSCERGSNENANKLIRRWLPKGSKFDKLKKKDVQLIEEWINNYPRKIFNYKCSKEVFENSFKEILNSV